MAKKEKVKKPKKNRNKKVPYIIGLIIVFMILFFGINYYLSQNYVYNIPFTNLNINGNNPIINADSENVGNVYYIKNNKLEEVTENKLQELKNSITANCTREYISFSTGYPRIVRNYIIYPPQEGSSNLQTSNTSSIVYSIDGSVNNNSFKGEVISSNSSINETKIKYTISQKPEQDSYINVYINNNDITMTPSNTKDSKATFTVDLSQGTYNIDYNFNNIQNAEKILNGIYNYVIYGNINK